MIEKFARYEVRKDAVAQAQALVAAFVNEVSRKEGGTAFYKAWQEVEHPTRFVHHMGFRTPTAEEYHRKTAWVKKFVEGLYPLCVQEPVFVEVRPVAAE
jgi:quinol monooxygenase YgiN